MRARVTMQPGQGTDVDFGEGTSVLTLVTDRLGLKIDQFEQTAGQDHRILRLNSEEVDPNEFGSTTLTDGDELVIAQGNASGV